MILILSLIFIILFHELGHLIVAKLCGCKVNIFSVGFGKPFFAKKFGETTYQIAPILLGGYCALDSELTLSDSLNAFTNIQRWGTSARLTPSMKTEAQFLPATRPTAGPWTGRRDTRSSAM